MYHDRRQYGSLDLYVSDPGSSQSTSYTTTFAGYEAAGMMAFSDDKLYQITNLIEIETSNDNKYIDAYFEIKALLTKKYGAPTSEAEYLEGSYDKYFPRGTYAGQAISLGKGVYQSRFQCNGEDNKYIHLGLSGDNYKISLNLSLQISKSELKLPPFFLLLIFLFLIELFLFEIL